MNRVFMRLLKHILPYKKQFGAGLVCILIVNLCSLAVPWIFKEIIGRILLEGDAYTLNLIGVIIVVLMLTKGIFFFGEQYLLFYVVHRIIVDLRNQMYENLQRLSLKFYDKNRVGEIMSRMTNDTNVVEQTLIMGVAETIKQFTLLIGIIVMIFYLHWRLSLLTIVIIPFVGLAMSRFGARMRIATRNIQRKAADITSVLQETLSGIRLVKAFTMEDYEIDRFSRENLGNFNVSMKGVQVQATLPPLVELVATLGLTTIILYGGHEVIRGNLSLADFTGFILYVTMATTPISVLSKTTNVLQRSSASAERIFEIIDWQNHVKERAHASTLPVIKGEVEFKDVTFSYDEEEALSNVSFKVNPGETVALVGPSGAGKTTVINLISRFYDPNEGSILIDGYDLREVTMYSLRSQLGIVPQETVLFKGTVKDNIAYGSLGANERDIIDAAKAANAHGFIQELSGGYDAEIGERGLSLSGGQRQRIAIARAILREPRILILDEATSALDTESEQLVKEALSRLLKGRTAFIIAHRMSTIENAHKILAFEGGKLLQQGTHDDLIMQKGLYSRLYEGQFTREV